ncbi:MAG TPA: hypothetical protein VEG44_05855 [Candidatus Acidoferrales bacterium]|nr:hypothetical protein [Candidatus Acidoferrales bacterium]
MNEFEVKNTTTKITNEPTTNEPISDQQAKFGSSARFYTILESKRPNNY